MKNILMYGGYEVLVDDDDYELLNQYKWHYIRGYAKRQKKRQELKETGRPITVSMHRFIMKPPPGMEVDHIDGNRLNNQRSNLRIVQPIENRMNKPNKCGFLGAKKDGSTRNTYRAQIFYKGKTIHLGSYKSAKEANQAYVKKARELYGELSVLSKYD